MTETEIISDTILESETDDTHYICCELSTGWLGRAKTYCGIWMIITVEGYSPEVTCADCMRISNSPVWCPQGFICERTEE
jgi:hypothetical protein